jgi:hypothetical protein
MKQFLYMIKFYWYTNKFLNTSNTIKRLYYYQKIKKYTDLLEKNKGSKIATFIRQMKQR